MQGKSALTEFLLTLSPHFFLYIYMASSIFRIETKCTYMNQKQNNNNKIFHSYSLASELREVVVAMECVLFDYGIPQCVHVSNRYKFCVYDETETQTR